jgi:hypothetical protein
MKRTSFFRFILLAAILSSEALFAATAADKSVFTFDLLGLPLSALDQGLGKRAGALGQALALTFPKDFKAQDFKENIYGGRCFVDANEQYQLSWKDSETEGFSFTVERMKDPKNCESPFTPSLTFKSVPLHSEQFSPLSHSHPSIQIGTSTPTQIQKEMGRPAYSSPTQLAYVSKRDRQKEKGCGMHPGNGELAAISVVFYFDKGILQSISLLNTIAGEC